MIRKNINTKEILRQRQLLATSTCQWIKCTTTSNTTNHTPFLACSCSSGLWIYCVCASHLRLLRWNIQQQIFRRTESITHSILSVIKCRNNIGYFHWLFIECIALLVFCTIRGSNSFRSNLIVRRTERLLKWACAKKMTRPSSLYTRPIDLLFILIGRTNVLFLREICLTTIHSAPTGWLYFSWEQLLVYYYCSLSELLASTTDPTLLWNKDGGSNQKRVEFKK